MSQIVDHIDIVLPIALLLLTYALRLFTDKSITGYEFLKSLCEFPVDIVFLSLSFLIAFTISHKGREIEGLLYFVVYIVLAIVIIFLRRRSIKLLEAQKWYCSLLLMLNMLLSVSAIFGSISLFSEEVEKLNSSEKIEQVDDGI